MVAQGWPGGVDAAAAALEAAHAWLDAAPEDEVVSLAVPDGSPRSADVWAGSGAQLGGASAVEHDGATWLAPVGTASRWEPVGLSAALLGLAAAGDGARRVVVPLGDEPPAGDAAAVWGASPEATRDALATLDVVALVGSDRPLLGFHGMAAALLDGREGDAALAAAAHEQEARWTDLARVGDAVAGRAALLGPARPSDEPGSGAAGGLAYALHVLGARLVPAAHGAADAAGLAEVAAGADLVVAIVPELTPRTLDHGLAAPASAAAARGAVPAVVLAAGVRVGKRDLMAAGLASAHEAAPGAEGLVDGVRRVAHTWSR